MVTPVPPAFRRRPQGPSPAAGRDSGQVALRLNRSLAEAFSCLQKLQQQRWLSHRWEIHKNSNANSPWKRRQQRHSEVASIISTVKCVCGVRF